MVGVESIFRADPWQLKRLLSYSDGVEHPVVLQIGGSNPSKVEEAVRRAQVSSQYISAQYHAFYSKTQIIILTQALTLMLTH